MNITVYCGSRRGSNPAYVEAAKKLGTWIGESGHTLVYGGGAEGIMNSVADSVLEQGGKVIGIIPEFLTIAEGVNEGLTETYIVDTMSERKALLIEKGDAYIALPGGVGTLEEISEIICRLHLGLTESPCIILDQNDFYRPLYDMLQRMTDDDFYGLDHLSELHFVSSVEEIPNLLNE